MIEKTLIVSGKEVTFRASATIPRIYRAKFKRDIFKDLTKLEKSYRDREDGTREFEIEDLEIFENLAYIMALHANPANTPKNIDDWLDQFDMFSIYEVCPEILKLWGENLNTDVKAEKNFVQQQGN